MKKIKKIIIAYISVIVASNFLFAVVPVSGAGVNFATAQDQNITMPDEDEDEDLNGDDDNSVQGAIYGQTNMNLQAQPQMPGTLRFGGAASISSAPCLYGYGCGHLRMIGRYGGYGRFGHFAYPGHSSIRCFVHHRCPPRLRINPYCPPYAF